MTADLQGAIRKCRDRIWRRLIHPDLGLIYDYVGPDGDDRAPFWWLPSSDEIAQRYPNPQGWSTGMEDSSLTGGFYLDAMIVVLLSAETDPYMQHGAVCDQLRHVVSTALSTYDYERLHSYGLVYAEALYWLAAGKQLIT